MSYQLYRNTTLGNTLQESLDELIQCGQITPHLALKVLLQFDKSINNALANRVKTRLTFKEKKRANQIAKEHGKSTLFVPDGLNFLEARQSQEACFDLSSAVDNFDSH